MCTLIVSFQADPDFPLIIAANRDEALDRPATGPRRWRGEDFIAPRDEQAGGTWLGLTRTGLFVGVTNHFPSVKDSSRASRGALVVEALRAPSAAALHQRLRAVKVADYNPFHLVYADDEAAFTTFSDGIEVKSLALGPGRHVITERSFGGEESGRQRLIAASWPTPVSAEGLMHLLAQRHPTEPLSSVSVSVPEYNYGTRSAMVLFRHRQLAHSRLWWAEGAPGVTPFVERPDLIAALEA